MIVTSSGKIIAGSKIIINDVVNEFLGTVNNLWNNPANWSLGIVPAANHVAIIKANCINAVDTVKHLMVNVNIALEISPNGLFTTKTILNLGTISRSAGNAASVNITLVSKDMNLGLINIAHNSGLLINSAETITDLTSQINPNSSLNRLYIDGGSVGIKGSIMANITGAIYTDGAGTIVTIIDNLTINSIGGSGPNNTIRLLNGVKLEANDITHGGNGSGILCEGNNEIIVKGNYTVSYNYHIPITVPVIFRTNNSTFRIQNQNVPPYVHNILIDGVRVTTTNYNTTPFILFNSKMNGTSQASEFILESGHTLHFLGNTGPTVDELMPIGILTLQINSALNYTLAGNQYIKPINYKQLGVMGSGVKSLKADTTCEHLYFSDTATLDVNGYTISGYAKYTDDGNIPRTVPNDTSIQEFNIIARHGGAKTLTGNIVCSLMNVTPAGFGTTYIDYSGFTITATVFHDTFNRPTHVGGIRDNINWAAFGGNSVVLSSPIVIRGTVTYAAGNVSGVSVTGGVTMADGSTFRTYAGGVSNQWLPLGISSYYNLNLLPFAQAVPHTINLRENIVVRGTYTRPAYVTINKNGFTIKDANGNDLE